MYVFTNVYVFVLVYLYTYCMYVRIYQHVLYIYNIHVCMCY